jgi:hypothetical protein
VGLDDRPRPVRPCPALPRGGLGVGSAQRRLSPASWTEGDRTQGSRAQACETTLRADPIFAA